MFSTPFFPIEAVDPALQAQAEQVLHWHYVSDTRVELHQPTVDRRTDTFDKHSTIVLGVLEYDHRSELWCVLAQLPPFKTPQAVRTRHLLPMAQQDLTTYLTTHHQL